MGFKLKENAGKEFQKVTEGQHIARCIGVFDLGTQDGTYQGKPRKTRQIVFRFEVPGQLIEDGDFAGKPMTIYSRKFTASLSEKSNLRPFLEAWRGARFTKEELDGFDPKRILGKPCVITVGHEESDGKVYANIIAIMGLMQGMACPEATNDLLYYSVEEPNLAALETLPKWIKEAIEKSEEHRAGGKAPAKADDDDIPF